MFGLLSRKPVPRLKSLEPETPKNYTRFHARPPQTRFPKHSPRPPKPAVETVVTPVAVAKPVLIEPGRIDENAHLHSDTKVCVSILRKALPQRFKEMSQVMASAAS